MNSSHTGDNSTRVVLVIASARPSGLGRRLLECARSELLQVGARVRVHDLLNDGFDPVLRMEAGQPHALPCTESEDPLVARYQADVRWAQSFVILHPVWWFAPPAILKGWIDRVLVHDVALRQVAGSAPVGLLGGKKLLVVQTFNTKRALDRIVFHGIASFFWKRVVAASVGIEKPRRLGLYSVEGLSAARLERFESRLRKAVRQLLP